jgi:Glycosyl hydrolase family 26
MTPRTAAGFRGPGARSLVSLLIAAVAAAVLLIVPAPGAGAGTTAVDPDRLGNDWHHWTPSRLGPRGHTISRSRAGHLRLRLLPAARPGTTALFTLRLPKGIVPTALAFRVSYTTNGGEVFIASGSRTRRVWKRRGGRKGLRKTARVPLSGRRTVIVGVRSLGRRPGAKKRNTFIVIHAYAVSTPGEPRGLSPRGPVGTAGGEDPAPAIYWGARVGGAPYGPGYEDAPFDPRSLSLFEQHAGKGLSLLLWGQPWFIDGQPQSFDTASFEAVRLHGTIPIIDWSPWDLGAGGGADQPDFQLSDVISGRYDEYIRQWATAAAAWNHPFFLRFCHEMNGTWYPWSERENGNSAGQFVRAWRHVHDIFEAAGAHNVTWLWSVNETEAYDGIPMAGLYPGPAYVDWTGLSGYNWGDGARGDNWRPFAGAFRKSYSRLRAVAPGKPLMIAETGSSEKGGSKAAWIHDALDVQLPQTFPAVRGFVWWNRADGGWDWPIETSADAQAAFAAGIGAPYYADNHFSSLSASPIPAP